MRQRPTLPHGFPCSTIGSGGLNFRVRDGNGCDPTDIATANLEKSGEAEAISRPNTKERRELARRAPRAVVRPNEFRSRPRTGRLRPEKRETKPHARLVPVS